MWIEWFFKVLVFVENCGYSWRYVIVWFNVLGIKSLIFKERFFEN